MITTNHLVLRQMEITDAPFIVTLLNSPGWLQYIGDRKVRSLADGERYILNGPVKSYAENGFGLLLVLERESGLPAGICGILKRDTLPYPDLGFALLPEYGGKGYAFEAGTSVLRHAREVLKLSTIAAITVPHNTRSVQLLEKLGFVLEKQMVSEEDGETLSFFTQKL